MDIYHPSHGAQAMCPRCASGPLSGCSPSGRGVAACDACGTWWEEVPVLLPNAEEAKAILHRSEDAAPAALAWAMAHQ